MQKVFVGLDGGGTRTTAVAVDEQGEVLAKVVGESINYYSMGMERARGHLRQIVQALQATTGLDRFEAAFVGNSALDQEAEGLAVESLLGDLMPTGRCWMHSDAFIALIALTLGEPGALVISGTGSMAIGKGRGDAMWSVGGWGYLLGDQGSAFDIASRGIKAGVAGYEGLGEKTSLSAAAARHFGAASMKDLIGLFYDPPKERHVLAGFASEVGHCASQGDGVATGILVQAGLELARHAEVLAARIGEPALEIGASGGVFKNNAIVFETFRQALNGRFPAARISLLSCPPEIGAAIECCRRYGLTPTREMQRKMIESHAAAEVSDVNGRNAIHP